MKDIHPIPVIKIYQKPCSTVESPTDTIKSPEDGVAAVAPLIAHTDREHFVVVCLNTKNKIMHMEIVHIGSLNSCLNHPREIFKGALLMNSAAILCVHNHPSQIITPSQEDIQMTQRLSEAGQLIGIELLDHLIINDKNEYYSMKEFSHIS